MALRRLAPKAARFYSAAQPMTRRYGCLCTSATLTASATSAFAASVQAQTAARFSSTSSTSSGTTGAGGGIDPKVVMAEARQMLKNLPPGVVKVTDINFDVEVGMCKDTPIILYFHVTSNHEVVQYTAAVISQIAAFNRNHAAMATDSDGGASGDTKLAIKCGLIDVEREYNLASQFKIQPDLFPLIYFITGGRVVDKMIGIVPESQVQQALTAFVDWSKANAGKVVPGSPQHVEQAKREALGRSGSAAASTNSAANASEKPDRPDEYEENTLTLQQAAVRKTQAKDYAKAFELFTKSRTMAEEKVKELRAKLGLDKKKMTPELTEKLRKDPNYVALPQAICGQAMVQLALRNMDEAWGYCQEVRREFPWAVRENRQIADTLCRVEMIRISGYDVDKDNYVTLMKNDDLTANTADFYRNQLRLAVAHYMERHSELAIEELMRLIRAEPKMASMLQKEGFVSAPEDGSQMTAQNKTPARRLLFLVFESMGNQHQAVVDARKKLQAFLYT
jgi:thioredoxin-like negative regulator of GroEL